MNFYIYYKKIIYKLWGFKNEILELRENGLSYNEIVKKLKCSKATVSYHCKRYDLGDIGLSRSKIDIDINELNEYYKSHSRKETALKFNIAESTVYRYVNKKREKLTEEEIKKRNYQRIKSRRQKIKKWIVEDRGGKCEICGYDKSIWSLQFHHKDPIEKDFTIGSSSVLSFDKIKNETDKCLLVCANCHAEIHENIYLEKENKKIK